MLVELTPPELRRDMSWPLTKLGRDCLRGELDLHGRLAIDFALGPEGNPVQITAWGLGERLDECVAGVVASWSFERARLMWTDKRVHAVVWVGYPDIPRLRTLRPWSSGTTCSR